MDAIDDTSLTPVYDAADDPVDADVSDLLKRLLDQLPEVEQTILNLRFEYEMTYAEIAACVELSEDAVKKRGGRALKKLRKLFQEG